MSKGVIFIDFSSFELQWPAHTNIVYLLWWFIWGLQYSPFIRNLQSGSEIVPTTLL